MKKNYILGIIGGLLGGIVASIPWILVYVYGNYILSLLATLIAFGVFYGYKLFKGPKTDKLPILIIIFSLLIVMVVTTVFIPLVTLYNSGYEASLSNLQILYASGTYRAAIIQDLIVSIVFTVLGIGVVVQRSKAEATGSGIKSTTN